ncbi:MAG: LysE family transporter [Bacteroidetes bacterium]|nr:LysE family transporter [Bacteroidota bacterium]
MRSFGKIFFWGMFISFAGSLPLGSMNVASIQIAVRDGSESALIYSFGSMIVELIYVRIILEAMAWVYKQAKIFKFLSWVTIAILLSMAIGSFTAGAKMSGLGSALPEFSKNHFLYGALLSAANPLHFIFWFGWSTVLLNKGILIQEKSHYNFYVAGIGIGTIAGFVVYIYGGNYLVSIIKDKQYILNWIIGTVLLITAIIQAYKTLSKSVLFKYRNV